MKKLNQLLPLLCVLAFISCSQMQNKSQANKSNAVSTSATAPAKQETKTTITKPKPTRSNVTVTSTENKNTERPLAQPPTDAGNKKVVSTLDINNLPEVDQPNVHKSTSRAKDEMVSTFPFDIDLKNADGEIMRSDQVFKNDKPTVLMFWLTTCAPCHRKMKKLVEVYDDMKKEADFNLYAISGDYTKNYPQFVSQVDKFDWPFVALNDMNREFRQVLPGGLNGYPQTFVFDEKGEMVYTKRKYSTGDLDKLRDVLKTL